MKALYCLITGYLLGCINPALIISKVKKKNIRESGTGNLGATNVMLNFGKGFGAFVMLFDVFKAVIAVDIAIFLCPTVRLAGLLSGVCAVLGHIFPFYLKFKGGKGLASFGGLVLALDPALFLMLLVLGLTLMFIVNYSYVMPFSAGALFPVIYGIKTGNTAVFMISAFVGGLIIFKHYENRGKALRGEDIRIRELLKSLIRR
ncbi:MAG: glycerol-3-phosphate acyltransferase [Ruminococcaceae bacterium]|nr:glycerol-3-phosphate acyltransferase [Oscillospiraceae bacterium]